MNKKQLYLNSKTIIDNILKNYKNNNHSLYLVFYTLLIKLKYENSILSYAFKTNLIDNFMNYYSNTIIIENSEDITLNKNNIIYLISLTVEQSRIFSQKFPEYEIFDFSEIFENKIGKRLSNIDMFYIDEIIFDKIEKLFFKSLLINSFSNNSILIYGAGTAGKILNHLYNNKIISFCDMNFKTIKKIKDKKVINPENITELTWDKVFISTIGREEEIEIYLTQKLNISAKKIIRLSDELKKSDYQKIINYLSQFELISQDDNLYYLSPRDYLEFSTIKHLNFKKIDDKPKVSIIIPVYNQFNFTYITLKSLLENISSEISYEVIVIDDCSNDEGIVNLHTIVKNIKIIRNDVNLGFLRNCNKAAKYANGEFIVLLNNDVIVQKNWLESLYTTIKNDNSIGLVGSKILFPNGTIQESGGIIYNDGTAKHYSRNHPYWNAPHCSYTRDVDYVSGASILIPKHLWNEINGFDELFAPAYCEDVDLAFSVREKGYRVVFQPESLLIHFEGISHGCDINVGLKRYQVINQKKFFTKWEKTLKNYHSPEIPDFISRENINDNPKILIFDYIIPTFDKDAGSRTISQYMSILKDLNYHITFIPLNYVSKEKYIKELQQKGIEVLYPDNPSIILEQWPKFIENWIENNAKFFNFAFILRPNVAEIFLPLCKRYHNLRIIFHGVDIHHLRMLRENNNKSNDTIRKMKETEVSLINEAEIVTTISEFEKNYIEEISSNQNIQVLPTFIYNKKFPFSKNDFQQRKNIMFVGGFNHTPNVDGILWFVKEILPKITKVFPDIVLNIAGSNPPQKIQQLNSKNILVLGYISDEKLHTLYNDSLVNIAPLKYGAGVKGKVIESIAYGVPIVTTKIASEGIMNNSTKIVYESSEKDFSDKVIELLSNNELWEDIRENQIKYSKKYLDINFGKKILQELFS